MAFERATQPEHKELRRAAIVAAAASLFDELGLHAVSLSAIARRARSSKANIYRYFESREAIYLAILEDEYEGLAGAIEASLAPLAQSDDPEAVAAAIAHGLSERPRLVHLSSLLGSVLEQNVSLDGVRRFKRQVSLALLRYLNSLHAAMPSLDIPTCERALTFIAAFGSGVFHVTNPGPVVQQLLKEPEFSWMHRDFEQTTRDHATVVLRGLLATAST